MSGSGDSSVNDLQVSIKCIVLDSLTATDVGIFFRFDCGILHLVRFWTHVTLVQR